MGISQQDIKLLWGRAAATCSFTDCRRKLTEDKAAANEAFPLGEQAHIVARETDGPRGVSPLTVDERDTYFNLVLLCPTHHTMVDADPERFPVERLHLMKRSHELEVERLWAVDPRAEVAAEVYAALVDAASEAGDFSNWDLWTGWVLGTYPRWQVDAKDRIFKFRQQVIGAAWPGTNLELERALKTYSLYLHFAAQRFWQESEDRGELRIGVKYYQQADGRANYDYLLARYEKWLEDIDFFIHQATKAANWIADVVRRDINPAFYAVSGRFTVTEPVDLSFQTSVPEFSATERATLPDGLPMPVELREPVE